MENRNPARVFGEVADDYDRVRPAYPVAVFEDVLAYGAHGPALEVGAGTGRATEQFAARGLPIVAVEPDAAMADRLARRIARFPQVRIFHGGFEQFRTGERFGLLFSAEAWHWTRPETRWSQAAGVLDDDATVALFWNNERIADPALRTSVVRIFARHAPSVTISDDPGFLERTWSGELSGVDAFGDLTIRRYEAGRAMARADYLDLTRTRSQFRMLPETVRNDLMTALTDLFSDEVPLTIHTTLLLARRRS